MSVLQARASLLRINELAYVYGGMEEDDRRTFIRELQYEAGGNNRGSVQERPASPDEMVKLMGGSKVRLVGE